MAAVKEIEKTIKAHQYVTDSIAYILSPENRNGDEKCFKSTCIDCHNSSADGLAMQFRAVRFAFDKDDKILAHHYVQSFSPNENINPDLAHKIGVKLAKKVAPGFQVIVATHIDKDHLHNHIIINSVGFETGLKWKGNGDTLKSIRAESDKLCKRYGLTTIDTQSGLRGIDQATQKLAEKGISWKVELCNALDEATKLCHGKEQFISFMKSKGFEITRYTDRHITFHKIGEDKKIRANTLAKQFGDNYTKENLEKLMGFYSLPKPLESLPKPKPEKVFVSEFEKYERSYFKKNPPPVSVSEAKKIQLLVRCAVNPFFLLLFIIMKLLLRKKGRQSLDREYSMLHLKLKPQKRYKTKKADTEAILKKHETQPVTAGNIPYKNLVQAQGSNFRVKLDLSAVPKLYAYPFFFSVKIYSDYAVVTVKEKDKKLLMQALSFENEQVLEKHNHHYTTMSEYNELKKRAEQLGVKVEYLVIQKDELDKLQNEKDRFVALPTKDGKIRLAFLQQNKDFILRTLYPDRYKSKDDIFSVSRNSKVNTRLKSEALLGGKKMRYRILSKEEVEHLAESIGEDRFAVFSKNAQGENLNGQYNVVFKEDDTEEIETALNDPKTTKRKI